MEFGKMNSKYAQNLVSAIRDENEDAQIEALQGMMNEVADSVRADFEQLQNTQDVNVLTDRGYRQLTSAETKFYQNLIKSAKAANPKQVLIDALSVDAMPTTILEDVYRDLAESSELIDAVTFEYVAYATKWILNGHSTKRAAWGKITAGIVEEITSSIEVVDVEQNKLSAFAIVEKGMLDLGPAFLDAYVRRVLKEALIVGLEYGIINGTGVDMPIGMTKDIHKGVSFNSETGYPDKVAVKLKDFSPIEYGKITSKLTKVEKTGKFRKVEGLVLICNPADYESKIMPATTVLRADGTYANDVLPRPTKVIQSICVAEGKVVIGLGKEYYVFAGGSKEGVIEYSDECKFLEDQRAYKIKQYAFGRAFDNNCFEVVDISALEPTYLTVKTVNEITA